MEQEARRVGLPQTLALTVVQMAQELACRSGSEFERLHNEWRMTPDDWLKIRFFSFGCQSSGVRISVGLPSAAFPADAARWALPGRWPGWCVFWLRHEAELPELQQLLNVAYYHADSDHRNRHGKPAKPA